MAKYEFALEKIKYYMENFRHPSMKKYEISGFYDLYPERETSIEVEGKWPGTWPNYDRSGVYLFLDEELKVVYIGKTDNFGYRLSSYFKYDENKNCLAKHNWKKNPRFLVTVAVPVETPFESPALEAFLLKNVPTTDNTSGIA